MSRTTPSSGPRLLIAGCGRLGRLLGSALAEGAEPRVWDGDAWQVCGLRRRPELSDPPWIQPSDPVAIGPSELTRRWPGPWTAILLAAGPGLRRGRDNRVEALAGVLAAAFPRTRLVYTGSTAVLGDQGGAWVDEDAVPDGSDPARRGLVAIEERVLADPANLVLRVGAILGPGREQLRERLRRGGGRIDLVGDPDRPFPCIHQLDLCRILVSALQGGLGAGLLHCVAPRCPTLRTYLQHLATEEGLDLRITTAEGTAPSRQIACHRLVDRLGPQWTWIAATGMAAPAMGPWPSG